MSIEYVHHIAIILLIIIILIIIIILLIRIIRLILIILLTGAGHGIRNMCPTYEISSCLHDVEHETTNVN